MIIITIVITDLRAWFGGEEKRKRRWQKMDNKSMLKNGKKDWGEICWEKEEKAKERKLFGKFFKQW